MSDPMQLAKLVRPLLLCNASLFLLFGLGYASELLPLSYGGAPAPAFRTDFAATAGGLQVGLGAGLFWKSSLQGSRSRDGLALAALATLSIALVRVAQMAGAGASSAFNSTLLGIELLGLVCNLGLFSATRRLS